jgi:hypothetical protein
VKAMEDRKVHAKLGVGRFNRPSVLLLAISTTIGVVLTATLGFHLGKSTQPEKLMALYVFGGNP